MTAVTPLWVPNRDELFVLIDHPHNVATLSLTKPQQCSRASRVSLRGVMPSGVLGQSPLPLTYPKQLNKVAHISAPAFKASRPKQLLPTCRMSPKGQAATSAVRDNGASYPSTAGPGSQRALVNTLAASSIRCCMFTVKSFGHCSQESFRRGQEGLGGQGGCFHL